jgi:hypothetical protein
VEGQIEALDVMIAERREAIAAFDPDLYRTKRAEMFAGLEPILSERGRLANELKAVAAKADGPKGGLAGLFDRGSVAATFGIRSLLELVAIILAGMILEFWRDLLAMLRPIPVSARPRDEYAQAVHDAGRAERLAMENPEPIPGLEMDDGEDDEVEDEGRPRPFVLSGSAREIVEGRFVNAVCRSMNDADPKRGPFAVYADHRLEEELGRGGSPGKAWNDAAGRLAMEGRAA